MIVLKTRVLHVKYDDYIYLIAQIEMKTPQGEKLFFLVIAERPKKAPAIALEKKIFERGVAVECWKSY